jgi:hypothetical protein
MVHWLQLRLKHFCMEMSCIFRGNSCNPFLEVNVKKNSRTYSILVIKYTMSENLILKSMQEFTDGSFVLIGSFNTQSHSISRKTDLSCYSY